MHANDNPQDPELTSGKNISFWTDSVPNPALNPLKENLETDVVIVGAGLAGMSVAYCLMQSGKKVIVVEDGAIGSGETGRTTAHLVTALDDRYYHLEKVFGADKTKLIASSHQTAIDFVEATVKAENIDCEFERVSGYLFKHPSDKADALENELKAALTAGVEIEAIAEVPGLLDKIDGLRFMNQAQFHPMKYLQGLKKAIEQKGGKIFTGTHAAEINQEGITSSEGFKISAKHIVVATNSPVNNLFMLIERQYAFRTYVIAALVKKNLLPKALWWDSGDFTANRKVPPYHYVRVQVYNENYDLLISGGEDHPIGDTGKTDVREEDRYDLVEAWTRQNFPIEDIVYKWSGQVLEPMDGLAFIGHNPHDKENVYIVTGDSGNGMTHCSFAGLLISDLIHGKENKWKELYSPSRFTVKESGPAVKQFINETISFLKQLPNFKDASELSSIKNGEGKIVDMLEEKFGVFRDDFGKLSIVSAQCTHLKCSVVWNADERSWDCPCHGSRFTCDGKVINGPANFNLPTYTFNAVENKVEKNE
ncbi:MAG: FAD-dependent oxidoreductase [Bacteroidetes bacterium]|nr:FAD-dependent oxidoreductase [Bacteroidota bacterium]